LIEAAAIIPAKSCWVNEDRVWRGMRYRLRMTSLLGILVLISGRSSIVGTTIR
jgi:hypothetical protein